MKRLLVSKSTQCQLVSNHTTTRNSDLSHPLLKLQRSIGNRAIQQLLPKTLTSKIQRQGSRRSPQPQVRIPPLEVFSAQYGDFLARNQRPLSQSERKIAESIFRNSINLDAVRIVWAPVANSPTTLGNSIRIAPKYELSSETLIHELAHVWQFQTHGTAYVSNSLLNQAVATITTGERGGAYKYGSVVGKSIYDFNAEQQAMIIQNYYSDIALRGNRDYQRMIDEVRSTRPIAFDAIIEEAAYGSGIHNPYTQIPSKSQPEPFHNPPNTSLIRVEF